MSRASSTTGLSVPALSAALQPVLIRHKDDEQSGVRLISALLELEMTEPFELRDVDDEEEDDELDWNRRKTYDSSVRCTARPGTSLGVRFDAANLKSRVGMRVVEILSTEGSLGRYAKIGMIVTNSEHATNTGCKDRAGRDFER